MLRGLSSACTGMVSRMYVWPGCTAMRNALRITACSRALTLEQSPRVRGWHLERSPMPDPRGQ